MGKLTETTETPVIRSPVTHWLWQIVPPLGLFSVFLATRSGSALVYLIGLLLLPVLFSLISVVAKLLRFHRRKRYLLRPLLTIAVFTAIVGIAEWTYQDSREQTLELAQVIHRQCQLNAACPALPSGWQQRDSVVRKDDLGRWMHYTALYHSDQETFNIRLYRGPDTGDLLLGGIKQPLLINPVAEN